MTISDANRPAPISHVVQRVVPQAAGIIVEIVRDPAVHPDAGIHPAIQIAISSEQLQALAAALKKSLSF